MQASILNSLIPFLSSFGYAIVVMATIVESLPIIGMIIPGGMVVHISGAFAKDAELNLYVLIAMSTVGAFIGDLIAFESGRKFGEKLITKHGPRVGFKEEYLYATHRFCHQYGGIALAVGRFNAIVRPLIPLVIGSARIPRWKFFVFSSIGAFLWSIFAVLIGYFARESWDLVVKHVSLYGGILFTVLIIAIVIFIRYEAKKIRAKRKQKQRQAFTEKFEKTHPSHFEEGPQKRYPTPPTHEEFMKEHQKEKAEHEKEEDNGSKDEV